MDTSRKTQRQEVEAFFARHGFEVIGTGGGCEAFERKFPELGAYVWITDAGDPSLPDDLQSRVIAGLYGDRADGTNALAWIEADTAPALMAAIAAGSWTAAS